MNEATSLNIDGFAQLLDDAGISVTASTGEQFVAIVNELPPLSEPQDVAQGKEPIYAHVEAALDSVENPHSVRTITEDETSRTHRVLKFLPRASAVTQRWLVETQRT